MPIALVTGGSRGIGAATCARLAQDGYDVAVGYATGEQRAQEVVAGVEHLGQRAIAVAADLATTQGATDLVDEVEARLGPVDVLIANAGVNDPAEQDVRRVDPELWDRFMAINLRAPYLLARGVLSGMLEREHGRIVLLSSVAAYTGGVVGPHYAASKAGLHGLAHSLSQFASGQGVTVNVVAPALIETEMLPSDAEGQAPLIEKVPVGRLGRAEEVADVIAMVVANGYLTNQSLLVDGGMHPL